jgi:DNA-binding NarL/FixJ family response regulator
VDRPASRERVGKGWRMRPLNLVLWQEDPTIARALAESLSHHFHTVSVAESLEEVRPLLEGGHAEVLVLDMEGERLELVERMHREFPSVCIVCTHRVADEAKWAAALDVGASDYCQASDTEGILLAAIRNVGEKHSAAA